MALRFVVTATILASTALSQITSAPASSTAVVPTAVTACHAHGPTQYCMYGTDEFQIVDAPTASPTPTEYTGCHAHGAAIYCFPPDGGEEVQIVPEGQEVTQEEPSSDEHSDEESGAVEECNCHFHAGVEHCVGYCPDEEAGCERVDRDYNIPLRIGLLFVILVTSAIGVFTPILLKQFLGRSDKINSVLLVVKQFGTGIIISTAFIHLYTHATLMFENECLGELSYEGTTAAILMAGLMISFLIDYLSHRFVQWRHRKTAAQRGSSPDNDSSSDRPSGNDAEGKPSTTLQAHSGHTHGLTPESAADKVTVLSLEAGILFHSILIGLILVVAGDSFFITLFIVIIFHQMFEGLALGSVLAAVPTNIMPLWQKFIGASAFALITPLGMAIGIGVLNSYNGNDPSTIIAIGTLDAFSAGILIWVGVVEMLSKDWMDGPLKDAGVLKTFAAGLSLVAGLILMSVLGKWA